MWPIIPTGNFFNNWLSMLYFIPISYYLFEKKYNSLKKLFKILNNISFKLNLSWFLFDKLFRASLNILLSVLLARHFGPENFGILNYLYCFYISV